MLIMCSEGNLKINIKPGNVGQRSEMKGKGKQFSGNAGQLRK